MTIPQPPGALAHESVVEIDLRGSREPWSPAITQLVPVEPTPVYQTFWRFAHERQTIYMRRLSGDPAPWTDDPILQVHRFTNAYRASDRVSQYLIRRVIYEGDQSPDEVLFRTLLFRLFNKIETWELLRSHLGPLLYSDGAVNDVEAILLEAARSGRTLYSAAYIIPPVPGVDADYKFQGHLALIDRMMTDRLAYRIADAVRLEDVFTTLRSYPGLGDFLAFQLTIDVNYSEICDFEESEYVVAGPGALSGISKCFTDIGDLSEQDLIHLLTDLQEEEFERLGLDFPDLMGRRLQPIDVQNLFCEVDKYSRVAHPDIVGASNRTRIKQKYQRLPRPLPPPWFPPKWGLNEDLPDVFVEEPADVPFEARLPLGSV